ncbi:hypothetical protein K3495_g13819 [Podosphaera aphanis]|nr:hypothetical protein K3495_g13819 [Podosphaera aphanis]
MDEKRDMEQQEQVEQQIKDAECIQMMQELRSGMVSHEEFNTFLSSLGLTLSFSTETSGPQAPVQEESRLNSGRDDNGPARVLNAPPNPRQIPHQRARQPTGHPGQGARNNQFQGRPARGHNANPRRDDPPRRNLEIPENYDRSTSANPYVNGSRVIQGEHVSLICGNSGHVAIRGGGNCPPGARRLDLIEAAILRSLMFPNDRSVEANMGHIRNRYFDDSNPDRRARQPATPQFVPDNIQANMISLNYHSDESVEGSQTKGNAFLGGLGEVDADVFGYEPTGPKRVRIDDDSDESYRVRRAAEANGRERREHWERRRKQENSGDKADIGSSNQRVRRTNTKLRNIVGREGKGPLD